MVTLIPWICPFGLMYTSSNGFLEFSYLIVFEKGLMWYSNYFHLDYHLNHSLNSKDTNYFSFLGDIQKFPRLLTPNFVDHL